MDVDLTVHLPAMRATEGRKSPCMPGHLSGDIAYLMFRGLRLAFWYTFRATTLPLRRSRAWYTTDAKPAPSFFWSSKSPRYHSSLLSSGGHTGVSQIVLRSEEGSGCREKRVRITTRGTTTQEEMCTDIVRHPALES